jgi:biopolymer transport protein ExbB
MTLARKSTSLIPRLLAHALALIALCSPALAKDAWWNDAWTSRKKVTIDTTTTGAGVTEPIGTSAVLLRLYDGNFSFDTATENLADLRFIAEDNQTVLPHHIEKLDTLMGEAFVWVKVPDLAPNEKRSFWLYSGSADPKAARTEDANACYDADTMLVFHFGESGAPASDSTKNGNSAENAGAPVSGACIGSGIGFNGRNPVAITASPSLAWNAGVPMTLTAWVKLGALQPQAVILSRREPGISFVLGADNGVPFVEINGRRAAATQPVAAGAWTHLAVVCESSKTSLYVNGEQSGSVATGAPLLNSNFILGGDGGEGASATGFTGELDELQIHKAARPPGFIQFAALAQNGDRVAATLAFGEAEHPTSWLTWLKSGTFGVIVANLTFDGWLVIIVLAVMAVLSWYVMVNKVRYLNGVSKGNEVFMKQWREVVSDLTVLDDGDPEKSRTLGGRFNAAMSKTLRQSSVYRIYHIGVEEVRHRISEDRSRGVERGLAGRSIQAVRASLDGGLVRETQKLNKLIVLLTICISGGPFLGLLGTVVGVMITFAAVAAAGEVNVNAIAPGIAAALLATVAGLAVAIPSLFGYNYILSRVKDAKDDMHVFIDEFVTRMAEFYKEKNN